MEISTNNFLAGMFDRYTCSATIPLRKRLLDILLVVGTSPVWVPVSLMCGLWIKLASGGDVFFRQKRIGYHKKIFTIFKFRTMKQGADAGIHERHIRDLFDSKEPMRKLDSKDARLIRGAGFIRAAGLDELPQLFNVLRGEMSLVGPRPCTEAELEHYRDCHRKRFNGLPGITGSWQVNGKNSTNFKRMIALDILYLRHVSVRSDLEVMLRTLPALVRQLAELVRNEPPRAGGMLDHKSNPA
jgi:lipopolysaccharide/colanic/teichoic acid biosynthesis glycosyltransferase